MFSQQSGAGQPNNPGSALGNIFAGFADYNAGNPASAAMPYLNQIPGMLQQYSMPYINQGMNAMQPYTQGGQWSSPMLQQQLQQLLSNPAALMNQIGSSYQQSPGYKFQTQQALQSANQAAAAGGMAGSPMEQQNIAGTVNQLANQDYSQYMQNALGLYGQGLSGLQNMYGIGAGLGQNQYDVGANMSQQLGENLAQNATTQANLAYAGKINQNQSQIGGLGSMGYGVGGLLSSGLMAGLF